MQGLDKINWYQTGAVSSKGAQAVSRKQPMQAEAQIPADNLQARLNAIGTGELSPKGNSEALDYYA